MSKHLAPGTSGQSHRKRTLVGIALLILAGLLVLYWLRGRSEAPAPPDSKAERSTGARPGASSSWRPLLRRTTPEPRASAEKPANAPVIDRIIVEKQEVCEGEENLISVEAHTPGNVDDAYLHYTIGGQSGSSIPLRVFLEPDGTVAQRMVVAFGKDNVHTSAPIPPYLVKRCGPFHTLMLNAFFVPNTQDTREIFARLIPAPREKLPTILRYRWEFGDGKTAETTEPRVIHDYSKRLQDAAFSTYVVKCEAIAADGQRFAARLTVHFENVAFTYHSRTGTVLLLTDLSPRFPEVDANGILEQRLVVYHHYYSAPIRITRVVRRRYLKPEGRNPGETPDGDEVDPKAILSTDAVPSEGIEAMVRLDTKAHPDVIWVDYQLYGVATDDPDTSAQGGYSLMRPTPLPTKEKSKGVKNPRLQEMIVRARRLLGKEFVTDEDLFRLTRMGHFKDLLRRKDGTLPDEPPRYPRDPMNPSP